MSTTPQPSQPFAGFRSLSANFTPTPNQFFDEIVGHYPLRVVSVVAILIRSTLGWQDKITGEKRIEAELPLSAFIRPELSENSARQGLREAITAGFVIETAKPTNREGARYALRWSDAVAQREAIERHRRAARDDRPFPETPEVSEEGTFSDHSDRSGGPKSGGPNIGPPISGGPNSAPPYKNKETFSEKEINIENQKKPLNVTPASQSTISFSDSTVNGSEDNAYRQLIQKAIGEVVTITGDATSSARWSQLMEICLRHNVCDAWTEALHSTQRAKLRQNRPANLGAYFNRVCVRELDKRGVPVPTKAEKAEAPDIREMIGASLGASLGGTLEALEKAPEAKGRMRGDS